MWEQYLAVPVPFIVVAFAYPLAGLRRFEGNVAGANCYRVACCLIWMAVTVTVFAYALDDRVALHQRMDRFASGRWVPIELHKLSADIASKTKEPEPVLTLGPLYAFEGGMEIYPELSCGSIVYRVADLMTSQERQITHTVGPETLRDLAGARPPAGVIVGVEPSYFAFLEEPLRKLVPPGWRRDIYGNTLQVYRRP